MQLAKPVAGTPKIPGFLRRMELIEGTASGGDAKFQGFCDRWNKWEGQPSRDPARFPVRSVQGHSITSSPVRKITPVRRTMRPAGNTFIDTDKFESSSLLASRHVLARLLSSLSPVSSPIGRPSPWNGSGALAQQAIRFDLFRLSFERRSTRDIPVFLARWGFFIFLPARVDNPAQQMHADRRRKRRKLPGQGKEKPDCKHEEI